MATPLSALWRAVFKYTVSGIQHVTRFYCDAAPGAGASGYDITMRSGAPNVDFTTVEVAFWTDIRNFYTASYPVTFDQSTLEQRIGISWFPVYAQVASTVPSGSGPSILGTGVIVSLRDTTFKPMKVYIQESSKIVPEKTTLPTGWDANWDAFLLSLTTPGATPGDHLWDWIVGRSGNYVGSFVSAVSDTNDELRRARGLA